MKWTKHLKGARNKEKHKTFAIRKYILVPFKRRTRLKQIPISTRISLGLINNHPNNFIPYPHARRYLLVIRMLIWIFIKSASLASLRYGIEGKKKQWTTLSLVHFFWQTGRTAKVSYSEWQIEWQRARNWISGLKTSRMEAVSHEISCHLETATKDLQNDCSLKSILHRFTRNLWTSLCRKGGRWRKKKSRGKQKSRRKIEIWTGKPYTSENSSPKVRFGTKGQP